MFAAIRSIRLKLLISYLLVVAFPVGILGVFFVDQLGTLIVRQAEQSERIGVLQLRENLSNYLGSLIEISQQIYLNDQISFYLGRRYPDPGVSAEGFYELLQPLFRNYASAQPGIQRIGVITTNPTMLTNGVEISRAVEGDFYWSIQSNAKENKNTVHWTRKDGPENIIVLYRSLGYHVADLGILVIEIEEDSLYRFMKEEADGVVVSLTTPDNVIVSSRDPNLVGLQLDEWLTLSARSERYKLTVRESFHLGKSSPGIWHIVKEVPLSQFASQVRSVKLYGIAASVIIFVVAVLLSVLLSRSMTSGIRNLSEQMSAVQGGDFTVRISSRRADEIGKLERTFNEMVSEIEALIEKDYRSEMQRRDLEIRRKEAEIYALQSQVDPHFLFNTLEAVVQGVNESRDGTAQIIQRLARLFRTSLKSHENLVSIKTEIEMVRDYLSIIQFRLEKRITYDIAIDEECESTQIPRFAIQPIVENAVRHGISPTKLGGEVRVIVHAIPDCVEICVSDNGEGMDAVTLTRIRRELSTQDALRKSGHIGLVNVHERLQLIFGKSSGVSLDSTKGIGTHVKIHIPKQAG